MILQMVRSFPDRVNKERNGRLKISSDQCWEKEVRKKKSIHYANQVYKVGIFSVAIESLVTVMVCHKKRRHRLGCAV